MVTRIKGVGLGTLVAAMVSDVKRFTIATINKAISRLELVKELGATIAASYTEDLAFGASKSSEAISHQGLVIGG